MTHHAERSISTTLLERVQLNDSTGWDRLVRMFAPLVYQWCRSKGLSEPSASDVSQEVFAAVHKSVKNFTRDKEGDSFRGWLWTITINKIRDYIRKNHNHPDAVGGTVFNQSMASVEFEKERDSNSQHSDENVVLKAALDLVKNEFEPRTIEVFLKSVLEGKTAAQVGEALGMSVAAVYKSKSRVLRRLREELGDLLN